MDDSELVANFQASRRSEESFAELMARHRIFVRAVCRRYVKAPQDEDCVQEIFLKVYQALPRFQARSSFKTWLRRIAVNHCLNLLQKQRRSRHLSIEQLAEDGVPLPSERALPELAAWDQRRQMQRVFVGMSDTLREPLLLKELEGLSIVEISERLEIGTSAVKMRLLRARQSFRDGWDAGGGDVNRLRASATA
ncbi:MAG: RNA polymerase sigma factor [Acidobacteriota bacterium]